MPVHCMTDAVAACGDGAYVAHMDTTVVGRDSGEESSQGTGRYNRGKVASRRWLAHVPDLHCCLLVLRELLNVTPPPAHIHCKHTVQSSYSCFCLIMFMLLPHACRTLSHFGLYSASVRAQWEETDGALWSASRNMPCVVLSCFCKVRPSTDSNVVIREHMGT